MFFCYDEAMGLIYVTGTPGTGKTTVFKELKHRGYEAHDIDEPRFGGPVNLATGESTTVPPIQERPSEWFEQHEWRISRPAIEKLKAESQGKTVYLCGTATTENLVWDLFDKVHYLNIDEETLKQRIANRTGNDFGKTPDELEIVLARHIKAQEKMKELNVTVVDATQSIDKVVDDVIASS
jgi:dephospho-CoA kinase